MVQIIESAGVLYQLSVHTVDSLCEMTYHHVLTPFPQTDIIGAMVIVWRVRGKIIRSVLCNIVCNNCVQCNAHTYEQN